MSTIVSLLPNNETFLLKVPYTNVEKGGVLALVIISCCSLAAVVGLFVSIALSTWNTRKSVNPHLFVRSHACAYLVSLLLCDLLQAIGSIMNVEWYMRNAVEYNSMCTTQGAIKHVADVGTALWSLIIALHTFWILFLRLETRRYILISTLLGGWSAIGAIVILGPATLDTAKNGPFFGISGYWCWISEYYYIPSITLDYLFLFISAFFSFILYFMIFFRIRGNIIVKGWKLKFTLHPGQSQGRQTTDSSIISVAKMMLLYPVAYTVMILPIAVCRFADWTGHKIPFAVTIFSDSIFLLSGVVNVVLFTTTRRVLPRHSVIPRRFSRRSSAKRSNTSSSFGSRTLIIDDDDDLEGSKVKVLSTYIDHNSEEWVKRGPEMFKTVSSPDDDGRSDSTYPSRYSDKYQHVSEPSVQTPVPQQAFRDPGATDPFPQGERFVRISLDRMGGSSSSVSSHSNHASEHRYGSEPGSPLVATDYVLRSPSLAE